MQLGTFKKNGDGYTGTINTLDLENVDIALVPYVGEGDNPPAYRVLARGRVILGAGWIKQTKANKPYVFVTIDDPRLSAPITANLFEGKDGEYDLMLVR